jgi:hypothetical protein
MSNDLILSIKNNLAAAQGELDEDTLAVAGVSQENTLKRISIEGGVFRKIVGGKEVGVLEDRHMNVIFVKLAHNPSRMYYNSTYKKGVKTNPTCWSSDGKVPNAEVPEPMAKDCFNCPMSVKGSSSTGQGTACRLSWRTAVVLPNDPSGDVMQMIVPAASCFGQESSGRWPFKPYVQMLAGHNISVGRVITKMQFDTNSSSPKLLFSPVGAVPPEMIDTVVSQARTNAADMAVKLNIQAKKKEDESVEVVAPPVPAAVPVAEEEPVEKAPKLREKKAAPETVAQPDIASVMQKWAKK